MADCAGLTLLVVLHKPSAVVLFEIGSSSFFFSVVFANFNRLTVNSLIIYTLLRVHVTLVTL